MSQIYKCDRCGKLISEVEMHSTVFRYDLCNDCFEEFKHWMDSPSDKNGIDDDDIGADTSDHWREVHRRD